jgi:hypothetical protein
MVEADGWRRLTLAPGRRRPFLAALEAVGFVVHRSRAWPDNVVVLRPGVRPDWSRGGLPATDSSEAIE